MRRVYFTRALLGLVTFFYLQISAQDKTVIVFSKSIAQEKKQDYLPAIETMMSLNDTTSYEVNLRLGWLYHKAGHKKRAIKYYNNAIGMKPNAIEPRYGFGFPASYLEDYTELIEQDKKILQIDPNNKVINGNLGSIFYYKKDYKTALPYFEKIASLYPFDYENNQMLGWTNLKLGKNTEAEQYFNLVLLYIPNDASAKEGLTACKGSFKNDEKVMAAVTSAYELAGKSDYKGAVNVMKAVYDKASYNLNLKLGWYCYLAGLQAESVNYYKTACELKPGSIEAKLGCALPTELLGNKNDLKVQFEAALKLDPHNTYVNYKLGMLAYDRKEYQIASGYFDKVLSLYPCDADALLMQAWTNYYMSKDAEAKSLFNKVLCFAPYNESAKYGLGLKSLDELKKPNPLKTY